MYKKNIKGGQFIVEEDKDCIRIAYTSGNKFADIYLREENGDLYLDLYGRDKEFPDYCLGSGTLDKTKINIIDRNDGIEVSMDDLDIHLKDRDDIVAEIYLDDYNEEFKLVDHNKGQKYKPRERESERVLEYNGPYRWWNQKSNCMKWGDKYVDY